VPPVEALPPAADVFVASESAVAVERLDGGVPFAALPGGRWFMGDAADGGRRGGGSRPLSGRLMAAIGDVAQLRTAERLLLASVGRRYDNPSEPLGPSDSAIDRVTGKDSDRTGDATRWAGLVTPVAEPRVRPED
jgi:hypothetical protein